MAVADTNANAPKTALAPHVLLAFDDFSLAGKYLLEQLHLDGAQQTHAALPDALASYAQLTQYTQDDARTLSVVTIATSSVDDDAPALWTLADAIVQWLSAHNVVSLRIVASLHLPQAKPHAEALKNVYVGGSNDLDATTPLLSLDPSWAISDPFLVRFLHLARVEQAFTTQLLVAKGYRPGRDGAGTRDAMQALAAALPLVVAGDVTVDVQRADAAATKAALTQKKKDPQQHGLLYQ